MTEVTRSIRSSHPDALESLKVLAEINGVNVNYSALTTTDESKKSVEVEMEIESHNPFNSSKTTRVVKGFTECAKALCDAVPESGLWSADVESWVKQAVLELTNLAYILEDSEGK